MKRISSSVRKEVLHAFSLGLSYRAIVEKTGVSKTSVIRIIASCAMKRSTTNTGRPSALSPRASRMLRSKFESGELINCTDGIKYLSSAAMGKVGGETIRRTLLKSGLKCYTKPLKPRLLPHHRAARLKFARNTQRAPESFWNHVVFTDESKFKLYAPDGNHTVWRRPGLPTKNHHFHHTVKFGGGSVMVWGAITYHGVGKLVFICTKMDSEVFIDVLSTGYSQTLEMHGYDNGQTVLQQDNDPNHTSRRTKEWLDASDNCVMPWPSYSPDLNPIEHMWNYVNIRVRARPVLPQNMAELKQMIAEELYAVPLEYIRALYDSMPRRIAAVINARGGPTKY